MDVWNMAKFYVESGSFQLVTHAADERAAAIWAVHRTMSDVLPFLAESGRKGLDGNAVGKLGETMSVSEQGFGREDAVKFKTFAIVSDWNHLVTALEKLEERMMTTAV